MNSQVSKDIQKDLCRRLGLTKNQGMEIVKSQFSLLRACIELYNYTERVFPVIRLPKFGLFFIKPSKLENYGKKA